MTLSEFLGSGGILVDGHNVPPEFHDCPDQVLIYTRNGRTEIQTASDEALNSALYDHHSLEHWDGDTLAWKWHGDINSARVLKSEVLALIDDLSLQAFGTRQLREAVQNMETV